MTRRPVVTGIGVVAPNGLGTTSYWSATRAGVSGIRPVARFDASGYPSRLAGEVAEFSPQAHLPARLLPQTDHMTRLALAAAAAAIEEAKAADCPGDPLERGVITASTAGGFEFGQRELQNLWRHGNEYVSAYQSFAWFYAVNTGQISIRHGLKGPSGVIVTDQAGGLDAIADARRQLRRGAKLILTGGVDGSICPWGWIGQMASGRLSQDDDPETAYLPFDARAAGHVPAEGGAILVIEDAQAARDRGAPVVYGEVAGYAATFDPAPGSEREPTLKRAITGALADAAMDPADIDVVFADAAGVRNLDQVEADAISAVFGERAIPVTAPKTMTGRMYAGAAAVDVAAALLSIRDGLIPPTINVQPSDGYLLDVVTEVRRPRRVRAAMVIARGYRGFNSVLIVRACSDATSKAERRVNNDSQ
jgi:act minimal PKS chain-length factor (CLF/KS beta)